MGREDCKSRDDCESKEDYEYGRRLLRGGPRKQTWGMAEMEHADPRTLTRVLRCAWESLVATKYCTGASRMMTAAPIKALTPRM